MTEMNEMRQIINYVNWSKEAKAIKLTQQEMKDKLKEVKKYRTKAKSHTKREDFTEYTYGICMHGDYAEIYMRENGKYVKYYCNAVDASKADKSPRTRPDIDFDTKFRELNGVSMRVAYGFVDKTLKRCIPKQFYYIDKKKIDRLIKASCVDASSQYPSGCYGPMPDFHTAILVKGRADPTEEYPFAFYASGHCAEYGRFDTREWMRSPYYLYLFRAGNEDWPMRFWVDDAKEETILMKPSQYTMDSTWDWFYAKKSSAEKGSEEREQAKSVMNRTIGCWHRKDKDKNRFMNYDNHGSYQLAHLAAIAICRGNQKLLDKIKSIGEMRILHVCVDGIIYAGSDPQYDQEKGIGKFEQEFIGADFMMAGLNVYCAKDENGTYFKHGGFDLIDGEPIMEDREWDFSDLHKLGLSERVYNMIEEE